MVKDSKSSSSEKKSPSKKLGPRDKILISFLKNVSFIIAGQASEEIIDVLYKKKKVNEFLIAKKLELTINQARNILYKLSDEGLVGFVRKKDKKSGGWYTYFWTLDVGKALLRLERYFLKDIENLKNQLTSKQTNQFYHCVTCDVEMSEEKALMNDFTCHECGEVFESKDNSSTVIVIEKKLENLTSKLEILQEEIKIIQKKEEVAKERRLKKIEDERKAELAIRRKERAKLREKEKKKITKKKTIKKKKVSKKVTKKKIAKKKSKKKTLKKIAKKFKKIKRKSSKK